jgi:putative salt-induced outer membrane protein YdiY
LPGLNNEYPLMFRAIEAESRRQEVEAAMKTRHVNTIPAIILCCTLLCSVPLHAKENADAILMKNGDRFTCEIKGLSGGVLSVKLNYVDGTIAVQWSQVAQLQSDRLFLVKTQSGAVYTGKLSTTGVSDDPPITIEIAETAGEVVEVPQRKIIKLSQTSEGFWRRFDGAVNTGTLYSKGNESAQFNLSSQVTYTRERWSSQASVNSSFATSSGSNLTTRNQTDVGATRLLRWNNWFYGGAASFLQSSVQGINLQTTLGGGIGRYLKNTNRASVSVIGGLGWQNASYGQDSVQQGTQNTAVGFVATEIKFFKFKKTNLDVSASLIPAISDPGRVHFNANTVYYIKIASDLSWNFSFYGSWDSHPPTTLPESDYGMSSGLSWTFGNR